MKIFNATCNAGVVSVGGKVVLNCPILGEGVGSSSGYLVMSENKLVYLPKTTPDVKSLIGIIEGLCDAISALTVTTISLGAPTSTPLNSASFIGIKTQLTTLKNMLK